VEPTQQPLPQPSAHITYSERFRQPGRFGSLSAIELTEILRRLDRGEVDQWADLCEFALGTDELLVSLYNTRVSRVVQAEFEVIPSEFGDKGAAKAAGEFINEQIGRIDNFRGLLRNMMHAVSPGFSISQLRYERDAASGIVFVQSHEHIHPHRFRYDDQWQARIWDQGLRRSSMYGDALDPRLFVVHRHQEHAGYPCMDGIMRSCIWRWLFRRWAETFWIQYVEKYGQPFVYAKFPPNTPDAVRAKAQAALESLSTDHAAVIETGGEIVIAAAHASSGSKSQHEMYVEASSSSLTTAWLGSADLTAPGSSGSNAAVTIRAGATMDPRMVADGFGLSETLKRSVFRWLLEFNLQEFGGTMPPVPSLSFKTAHDEVNVDAGKAKIEMAQQDTPGNADGSGADAAAQPAPDVQANPAPKPSKGPNPTAKAPGGKRAMSADPKARSRPTGRRKSKTAESQMTISQTTSLAQSPLAQALLGRSVGPRP
jgi:phage gp29-like protein